MGKVTSLHGKVTGKVGSLVYATTAGETIVREYNPHVANPSTVKQVDQRAKFKLLSQLASALAPVIVMQKSGLVSRRNKFVKRNSDATSSNSGIAQVTYENLQLTDGNAGLPAIVASRSQQTGVAIHLSEDASQSISRCVYIMYRKTDENKLQFVQSQVVEAAGSDGLFPATLPYMEGDCILFAYGMRDLSASATAKYGNYAVQNAVDIATLVMSRNISSSDYQFTETRGTTMFAGETETAVVGDNQARVYVTSSGPGTVSGAGVYNIGSNVTVVATPNENATFVGWKENGTDTIVSTSETYSFTLNGLTDLVAVFEAETVAQSYVVSVELASGSPAGMTVSSNPANGIVNAGNSITITASAAPSGYVFMGWYRIGAGTLLSNNRVYTFTPNASVRLEARYAPESEDPEG